MNTTTVNLDAVFGSLADTTRRAILARVLERPRTIGELAEDHLKMSFAAISKHVAVLAEAGVVTKRKDGPFRIVSANPIAIDAANTALAEYKAMLNQSFNQLETLLEQKLKT